MANSKNLKLFFDELIYSISNEPLHCLCSRYEGQPSRIVIMDIY